MPFRYRNITSGDTVTALTDATSSGIRTARRRFGCRGRLRLQRKRRQQPQGGDRGRPIERLVVFTEYKTTLDHLEARLLEHYGEEAAADIDQHRLRIEAR